MNIEEIKNNLIEHIEIILNKFTPPENNKSNSLHSVYRYALLPPGKLFRPLLTIASYKDFTNKEIPDKLYNLALAFEIHHAYSLIHDDMPMMDDDDWRRGKWSVHKKFGTWKALLAGDGLLNLSYQLVGKNAPYLVPLMGKMCGPQGLIHGQFLDLDILNAKDNSNTLINIIHVLKTGRLIQLSLLAGIFFEKEYANWKNFKTLIKLGYHLGLYFQYNDDFNDYKSEKETPSNSLHEKNINPFYLNYELSFITMEKEKNKVIEIIKQNKLYNILSIIQNFSDFSASTIFG